MFAAGRHGLEAGGEVAVAREMFFICQTETPCGSLRSAREFRV
ncbi:MAG: hypothetical protein RL261_2492, partial [Pseudomonadota bacterium]